jgi:hypothetical protein
MTQYTPGPWTIAQDGSGNILGPLDGNSHEIITKVPWIPNALSSHVTQAHFKANAQLIASAPELLRELEEQHEALNEERDHHMPSMCGTCKLIAKAKGD